MVEEKKIGSRSPSTKVLYDITGPRDHRGLPVGTQRSNGHRDSGRTPPTSGAVRGSPPDSALVW